MGPVDLADLADLSGLTPLAGGWSGQTFVTPVVDDGDGGPGERLVVRIYPPGAGGPRGDAAPEVDAALLALVRGLVPVPDVVEVRRPRASDDVPGLLVTRFVPGVRGDELIADLVECGDDDLLARLGTSVGELVATLGGMPMRAFGPFVDAELGIGSFGDLDLAGYAAETLTALDRRGRLRHWDDDARAALVVHAAQAQLVLDEAGRVCLAHSDLNPKNFLVDPDTLEVVALLDWEFAHAGHPFTDLGNVLRFEGPDSPPHGAYAGAVLAAYERLRGVSPGEALRQARAADLWALLELTGRRGEHGESPVSVRAEARLHASVTAAAAQRRGMDPSGPAA